LHRVLDSNDGENEALALERLQELLLQSNAVTSVMSNASPIGAFLETEEGTH